MSGGVLTDHGSSPAGGTFAIEVPEGWRGELLLYSRGLPMGESDPPWPAGDRLVGALLNAGYAVAGTGGPMFWPLEKTFVNQQALLDRFVETVAEPEHTIAWGLSIGGIMAAGLVQRMPGRLSGALPLCGNLAGAIGVHNRELDIAFVLKTLLAPDSTLQLVRITDQRANLDAALSLLAQARHSPAGRARLALAAAVGNIPGWFDPLEPEPEAHQLDERLDNQLSWFDEPGLLVYFMMRAQVERQAGGNASWNEGVDYAQLLAASSSQADVAALYARAQLDLEADLTVLQDAPRITADPDAVRYLERNIVFSGDLGGVPVLTMHTDGDGLVTPANETAYGEVVAATGQQELLRQLFVHRGGHCSFTAAEVLVALRALLDRIRTGTWPTFEPDACNAAAAALGGELNVLARTGEPASPAFMTYSPGRFSRPYDHRDMTAPLTSRREVPQ